MHKSQHLAVQQYATVLVTQQIQLILARETLASETFSLRDTYSSVKTAIVRKDRRNIITYFDGIISRNVIESFSGNINA